jgi:hypothetical protein
MHSIRRLAALLIAGLLSACAHPMVITPDIATLQHEVNAVPINKKVGYYVADDKRALEVTTPGGGGDKVTYKPYADIETGLYKILGNVFAGVTILKAPNDAGAIARNGLSYVLVPELVTRSSSSSLVTWPPTQFTMEMTCVITDVKGAVVANPKVVGEGKAEYSEFMADLSLSGKRAAQDALLKMQSSLLNTPGLRE